MLTVPRSSLALTCHFRMLWMAVIDQQRLTYQRLAILSGRLAKRF
jgi:hypothetical protein